MIWADILHQAKAKKPNISNESLIWDNLSLLSGITFFNLLTIIGWISYYLNGSLYKFELGWVMPGSLIDRIISYGIQLYLPSIIINYFVIFFRNKHLRIMKKYPSKDGKYAFGYVLVSIGLLAISAIIGGILIRSGITLR
jgi:uncharacterized membrane protein AbrB (regulator of aidB expression)